MIENPIRIAKDSQHDIPFLVVVVGQNLAIRSVDKAYRRGKIGWDVGKHIEVIPHFRHPPMTLARTGAGRVVPNTMPRRGSVVHREAVEKLPSGCGGGL